VWVAGHPRLEVEGAGELLGELLGISEVGANLGRIGIAVPGRGLGPIKNVEAWPGRSPECTEASRLSPGTAMLTQVVRYSALSRERKSG
jgi:hypothetical protein